MAASGVALTASVAKAASVPVAAASAAPLVVVVQSMSSGGVLPWLQLAVTAFVALVAAGIAGTIQWRQMQIAKGALRTADNKLRFDLFEKRLAIFEAGLALLTDQYLDDDDPSPHGDYQRLAALTKKTAGAGWLTNDLTQEFLVQLAVDAQARLQDLPERSERIKRAWDGKGWHITEEVQADRDRQAREQRYLVALFHRFLYIDH